MMGWVNPDIYIYAYIYKNIMCICLYLYVYIGTYIVGLEALARDGLG